MPDKKELTQTEILKDYLLTKENPYLLDDNNNGKTIMLSGAWGSGKTHFWQEEIAREQKKIKISNKEVNKYTAKEYEEGLHSKLKKKKKACVYVSLYGKTSIEALELDVYMKAYQNIVGDADTVSTMCSVFTNLGKNLGNMAHKGVGGTFAWMENLVDKDKFNKASTYLKDGGIICFDDFERKSKEIDLNDLFGFISQLALEYRCKIIIILNSDVFKGKEAEIFSNVREKTISKFFYFNPTIKELFISISDNPRYDKLDKHKTNILSAIEETTELNARIYILVLDNCLEWITEYKDSRPKVLRTLILTTISSTRHNLWLSYPTKKHIPYRYLSGLDVLFYTIMKSYPLEIIGILEELSTENIHIDDKEIYNKLIKTIVSQDEIKTSEMRLHYKEWCTKHKEELEILWKYGFKLNTFDSVDEVIYKKIYNFIETGILLP